MKKVSGERVMRRTPQPSYSTFPCDSRSRFFLPSQLHYFFEWYIITGNSPAHVTSATSATRTPKTDLPIMVWWWCAGTLTICAVCGVSRSIENWLIGRVRTSVGDDTISTCMYTVVVSPTPSKSTVYWYWYGQIPGRWLEGPVNYRFTLRWNELNFLFNGSFVTASFSIIIWICDMPTQHSTMTISGWSSALKELRYVPLGISSDTFIVIRQNYGVNGEWLDEKEIRHSQQGRGVSLTHYLTHHQLSCGCGNDQEGYLVRLKNRVDHIDKLDLCHMMAMLLIPHYVSSCNDSRLS